MYVCVCARARAMQCLHMHFLHSCVKGYENGIFKNKLKFRLRLQWRNSFCCRQCQLVEIQSTTHTLIAPMHTTEVEMAIFFSFCFVLYATSYGIIIKLTFEIQCWLEFWWVFCLHSNRHDASTDQFQSKHSTLYSYNVDWNSFTK